MTERRIVIIGAGPTGLGAALRCIERDHENYIIYEKESTAGGLAGSITDEKGFTWDFGPHVTFSHYTWYDEMLSTLGPPYVDVKRKCVLLMNRGNNVIKYPLQFHIHQLPEQYHESCLEGLREAKVLREQCESSDSKVLKDSADLDGSDPDETSTVSTAPTASSISPKSKEKAAENMAEWGMKVFGRGILEVFLRPYNEKIWSWPLEQLNSTWLGERVPVVDLEKVQQLYDTKSVDVSWGPNNTFKFPRVGGTGAIWRAASKHIPNIKYNVNILSIDPERKTIVRMTEGGALTEHYDSILTTIPLPDLVELLPNRYIELRKLVKRLRYSSTNVVCLGVEGPAPEVVKDNQWFYLPDSDSVFYRCSVMSNFSPNVVPDVTQHYSLMFEMAQTPHHSRRFWRDNDVLIDKAIQTAACYGLIGLDCCIIDRLLFHKKYGYPSPTTDRDVVLNRIQNELMSMNIYSRGRFGGWKYEAGNMDHSCMQGVEAVDAILSKTDSVPGSPSSLGLDDDSCYQGTGEFSQEPTYFETNWVNGRKSTYHFVPRNFSSLLE